MRLVDLRDRNSSPYAVARVDAVAWHCDVSSRRCNRTVGASSGRFHSRSVTGVAKRRRGAGLPAEVARVLQELQASEPRFSL